MSDALLESLVRSIRTACPSVRRIILFGSRARGDARPRSDIDLAIDCPDAKREEWLRVCDAIEDADTLLSIDMIRLDTAPRALRERIEAEGRPVYEQRPDQAGGGELPARLRSSRPPPQPSPVKSTG